MTKTYLHAAALAGFATLLLGAPQGRAEALSADEIAEMRAEDAAAKRPRQDSAAGQPCGGTGAAGK